MPLEIPIENRILWMVIRIRDRHFLTRRQMRKPNPQRCVSWALAVAQANTCYSAPASAPAVAFQDNSPSRYRMQAEHYLRDQGSGHEHREDQRHYEMASNASHRKFLDESLHFIGIRQG